MWQSLLTNFALNCKPTFFGLKPWYIYLNPHPQGNPPTCVLDVGPIIGPHSVILLVLLAVIDDLLILAGLVAVGFIIYGGIRYMTSQGNPEQTAKAQSTIVDALIGLVIAIMAVALVSFLGHRLGS